MSQKTNVQESWNLLDDGLLWKEVIKGAADRESFRKQAEEFVSQLQLAARPKNALEGLLLDRMASSHLRKVMLLEVESGLRSYYRASRRNDPFGKTSEMNKLSIVAYSLPTLDPGFNALLKHESMLDRGFHRDTSLLQQLQKVAGENTPLPPKKPAKSNGKTIEGDTREPTVG